MPFQRTALQVRAEHSGLLTVLPHLPCSTPPCNVLLVKLCCTASRAVWVYHSPRVNSAYTCSPLLLSALRKTSCYVC